MPRYDYKCDSCGDIAEFSFSIHDDLPVNILHLECDGNYHRLYNPTPGHFKGQGWGKVYRVHKGKRID